MRRSFPPAVDTAPPQAIDRPAAAAEAAVYFFLHIPKTAGQTIEAHLAEHCAPGVYWNPSRAPFPASLLGRRHRLLEGRDVRQVRAVAGHEIGGSLERHFHGREIRRIVLLREPLGLQLSFYNYRMMNHLNKGRGTYGFDLHLRDQPRNLVAHWLLARWLEIPWPLLLALSDEHKYRLVNRALSAFWFVGAYTDCDRLIAAIAPDLGIPPVPRPRNTAGHWQKFIDWQPLTAETLSPAMRKRLISRSALDQALWQSWHDAGFDAALVRPVPLGRAPQWTFVADEARRPLFRFARWFRRDAAPRLPFLRPRQGPDTGAARADRARDAGQWRLAARHYRRALAEKPGSPTLWVAYAEALNKTGDATRAERACRRALRLEPDHAGAQAMLLVLGWSRPRIAEALRHDERRKVAAGAVLRA